MTIRPRFRADHRSFRCGSVPEKCYRRATKRIFLVAFLSTIVYRDHLEFLKEGGVLLYDSDNVEPNLDDKRFRVCRCADYRINRRSAGGTAKDKGKNIFVLGLIAKIFTLDVEKLAS